MSDNKRLGDAGKASFWYTVCGIIQRTLGLIIVPVFTRIMGAGDYGIYTISQSWYYILSIFITLNLGEYVFYNGLMKYEEDQAGFSSSMLGLSSLVTIAWMIVFLATPGFWAGLLGMSAPVVALIIVRCLVTPCYQYWSAKLRYEYEYKPLVVLTVALTVLTPLVSIPIIIISEDKAFAALVCQVCVMGAVYLIPCISILKESRRLFNLKYWVFALKFNIPLLPHFLAMIGLQQFGRIIISYMLGVEAAAVFSVAYSAAMVITVVSTSLVQSLVPLTYQCMKVKDYDTINKSGLIGIGAVGASCAALAIVAPEIMQVMAPPSYQVGTALIPTLCSSVVFMFLFNLFANVQYYYEETKQVALASVTAAGANILLTVLSVSVIGFSGPAYASLISYGLFAAGHYLLMRRVLRKHNGGETVYNSKRLFSVSILIVLFIQALSIAYPYPVVRYVIVIAMLIAAVAKRRQIVAVVKKLKK